MIPPEQLKAVKEKIISLLDLNLPKDQKDAAIKQINSMSGDQLETFLKQNNLTQQGKSTLDPGSKGASAEPLGCIFCAIADGKTESYKLDENKYAIAVLELNPMSVGHVLVIPKTHVPNSSDLPSQSFTLAKKICKKLKTKLKPEPENIQISNSNMFGHEVIQVIPIYKDQDPNQERKPADKDELFKLQILLGKKARKKTVRKPRTKKVDSKETKVRIPIRIP